MSIGKKRILIFSLSYFPYVGGAEVAIDEITKRLNPADFSFDMVTLRYNSELPRTERLGSVTVHRIGFTTKDPSYKDMVSSPLYLAKVFYPILAAAKAIQLHKENKFDIVWSMMTYMGFPAVFFKWKYPSVPFVLTIQDGDTIEKVAKRARIRMVAPLFRRIFKVADLVQVLTKYLEGFARDMGYKGPLEVIPNGVDFAFFSSKLSDQQKSAMRAKRNIEEGEILVLNASRLVEKNGVDDSILALEYLPENVKMLIMSDGPDRDKLLALVMKKNLQERVCFFGAYTPEELASNLQIADVFTRPSHSEGQGIAFLEAMAAGVPIVTTEVGGIPDFITDPSSKLGKVLPTGLFAKIGDPKDIAEKIQQLLDDPELAYVLSANAKQLVKEKYDWMNLAEDMRKKVFDKVLS